MAGGPPVPDTFVYPDELKSAIYQYAMNEISESDLDIQLMAIEAATEEVKSYLTPGDQTKYRDGRKRYDVAVIFAARGSNRNPLIVEITKSIAVYWLTRLANVDVIAEDIMKRYDRAIDWLEKVSASGKYAGKDPLNVDLPVLADLDAESDESMPFRNGSREKFTHE